MSPPKLTGNAPVVHVLHPVDIDLREPLGRKLHPTVLHNLQRGFCERRHLHKPLIRCNRLNGGVAAVAGSHVVRVRLYANQIAVRFQIGNQRLARLVAIHARILAAVGVDGRVVIHDLDHRQVVPLTDQKVVRVMRGRNLHTACPKADFHVLVGNYGDLPPHKRQNQRFADQVLGLFVVRVDRNRGIAEHCFGTGGRNLHVLPLFALDGVTDMPEIALLFGVFDLRVGQRCNAMRTPVDDAVAAVDQSLFIEVDEHLPHGFGTALVKGKALSGPVAGRAEFLQLTRDARLVLILPLPHALEEFLAPEVVAGQPLLHAQAFLDLDLRGDARVVCSGNPKGIVALHPLIANQNILQGLVERVPHVELSRDVGRRDDHRKMLRLIGYVGRKIALVAPILVDTILKFCRLIGFRQFVLFVHSFLRESENNSP